MSFREKMMKQFGNPQGLLGILAGFIMAKRTSNIERNLWAISLLEIQPENIVLEIGCGPGIAVEIIASHLTTGNIIALDHSNVMLNMAKKRNIDSAKNGKAIFHQTDIRLYESPPNSFDRIFSSNVVQFWDDPVKVFVKLKEMLKPGGRIVTNYMARQQNATSEDTLAFGRILEDYSLKAGFEHIETKILDIRPVSSCSIIGTKL